MTKDEKKDLKKGLFASTAFLFVLFFCTISPNKAFASNCYTASGFGTTSVNGSWTDTGTTANGKPIYINGVNYLVKADTNGFMEIADNNAHNGTGNVWYFDLTGYSAPDTATWTVNDGSSPAGTFVSVSCGGGGGGGTTTPISFFYASSSVFTIGSVASSTASGTTESFVNLTPYGIDLINNLTSQAFLLSLVGIMLILILIILYILSK